MIGQRVEISKQAALPIATALPPRRAPLRLSAPCHSTLLIFPMKTPRLNPPVTSWLRYWFVVLVILVGVALPIWAGA